MCGIYGLYRNEPPEIEEVVRGVAHLNHRGHEAVGIAATNGQSIDSLRGPGYVREVCTDRFAEWRGFLERVSTAKAHAFIGHTRYSTVGASDLALAQPLRVESQQFGEFYLAHNGQLPQHEMLRNQLRDGGHVFLTTSDSEVLGALIAKAEASDLPGAVAEVIRTIPGAFSLIALSRQYLVAARDRFGVRPLWWSQSDTGASFASEVAALGNDGAMPQEVAPGSLVVVTGNPTTTAVVTKVIEAERAGCIFETLYFARPDQRLGEVSTSSVRRKLGRRLAQACPVEADFVCGVPDSGNPAALGFAEQSGLRHEPDALVKNWYSVGGSGRSFIQSTQARRKRAAGEKFSVDTLLVKGKRIVVVDDTLVRGTTAPQLTQMFRQAGAKEIHWRIAAAPITHPCFFGINIPTSAELPASRFDENTLNRELVGADSLRYLPYEAMVEVVSSEQNGLCTACFNGNYPMLVPLGS